MKFSSTLALACLVTACSDPGAGSGGVTAPDCGAGGCGDGEDATARPDGDRPADDPDAVTTVCVPDERRCDGNGVLRCRQDGAGFELVAQCLDDQVCGNGVCRPCTASQRRCTVAGVIETCDEASRWTTTRDCASEGLACVAGSCRSPCERDPKSNDNSGCDYWALDMDNHPLAQNGPYAVIVSNLYSLPATVKVTSKDSPTAFPVVVREVDVLPGQLGILELPNRNMAGAGIFWSAYRVESTVPIVAYQFNPLDNVDVFSNDASLLIPSNTYGLEYFVFSRFELMGTGTTSDSRIAYRGMFAVIAGEARTTVTVVPTCRTQAGFAMPNMNAGQSYTYLLEPYQVLNVKSEENAGDLTGSLVLADKPVAVFGGHEAALTRDLCCADHMEQQLFPVATWGTTYVATKSKARQAESDYWRVIAAEDNTTVTFTPAITAPFHIDRGEWFEVPTRSDFVIRANRPISVAQTLASSFEVVIPAPYSECGDDQRCATGYTCQAYGQDDERSVCFPPICEPGEFSCPVGHTCTSFGSGLAACTPVGDPALIIIPPVKQFRSEYVFLAPDKYAEDYVNIVAPDAASVTLDGTLVAAERFTPIGSTGWKVARLAVTDGVHRVLGDQPVGVIVYGYDRDVSYGYAAGLSLVVDD